MDPEIAALLESLSPEDLSALLDMGVADDAQGIQGLGLQNAQELRGTPMPEGMHAGGTFTAANPLQFLSAALRQRKGEKEWQKGIEGMTGILGQKRGGLAQLLAMLRGQESPTGGPVEAPQMIQP